MLIEVPDNERISRYLFFKRWFARESRRVKPDAFVPHPYIELSVSCTHGLAEEAVWEIGRNTAESRKDKPPLLGRGDLAAGHVRKQGLLVARDDHPPFHANILGWPTDGKSAQRMKAVELAAESTLFLVDDPVSTSE